MPNNVVREGTPSLNSYTYTKCRWCNKRHGEVYWAFGKPYATEMTPESERQGLCQSCYQKHYTGQKPPSLEAYLKTLTSTGRKSALAAMQAELKQLEEDDRPCRGGHHCARPSCERCNP